MKVNFIVINQWWDNLTPHQQTALLDKYKIYDESGYDCHKTPSVSDIEEIYLKEHGA